MGDESATVGEHFAKCFWLDRATSIAEDDKADAALNYFSEVSGSSHYRVDLLDFEALGIHLRDLSELPWVVHSRIMRFGWS